MNYLYSEAFMVVSAGRILSFFEEEKVPVEFLRRRGNAFEEEREEYHRYSFRVPEEWGEYVNYKLPMHLHLDSPHKEGFTWISLDQMKEIVYTYEVLDS
jgi:hypothetical protein